MAHQHVFLVQDKAFELSCLKARSKTQQQQGGELHVANGLLAKIVDFAHPRTGDYNQQKVVDTMQNRAQTAAARPRTVQSSMS